MSKASVGKGDWASLEFAGATVAPGQRSRFELPVARLQTDAEASLPVVVLHGARPGPKVWIDAALHGDELNGVEVIRRLLVALDPERMAGTLFAVPIVNVFGFLHQSRYLPDRRDLNRSFPGSARGPLAARLAHIFTTQIVDRCTHGIDLHTGSDGRTNLPQVRADLDDPETMRIAEAFAAPVALHASLRDGSLRAVARKRGAKVLLYEAGESMRFDEAAIRAGFDGALRVLQALEIVDDAPDASGRCYLSRRSAWVRAPRSGLFHAALGLGAACVKGQELGFVTTPYGADKTAVRARQAGIVIGLATNPHVYQGDALVHVAERRDEPRDSTSG